MFLRSHGTTLVDLPCFDIPRRQQPGRPTTLNASHGTLLSTSLTRSPSVYSCYRDRPSSSGPGCKGSELLTTVHTPLPTLKSGLPATS